jgi:hypothetical protein
MDSNNEYKICPCCGKKFYREWLRLQSWNKKKFCSQKCYKYMQVRDILPDDNEECYTSSDKEYTRMDFLDNWDVDPEDLKMAQRRFTAAQLDRYFSYVKKKVLDGSVIDFRTGFGWFLENFM